MTSHARSKVTGKNALKLPLDGALPGRTADKSFFLLPRGVPCQAWEETQEGGPEQAAQSLFGIRPCRCRPQAHATILKLSTEVIGAGHCPISDNSLGFLKPATRLS